ncbi:MerR family transcriptional regulator [Streptomyces rimosus]|uniref:MerR family transcriptional regulator n=1 Tax=Streptomyces rimosus TaxID=1927 RepID=UPI0004C9D8AF|nr:MerR family transcriptional regulator [Streptomyces rimosus]
MGTLRISQLAERCGVPATTLRFYEKAGLLAADRTSAGYRVYGEEAIERLGFIGAAKHLGLPLAEIGELLAVRESGACREVKADLRPRIAARLAEAEQRAAELAAFTTSLHAALDHLDALPDRAERCDPRCGFPVTARPPAFFRPVGDSLSTGPEAAGEEREQWRIAPVACSLTENAMADRVGRWRAAVADAVRADLPDGVRLTLPADRTAMIAGLAAAEQRCCPFFDFRFHLDGAVVHLEVRAPADGREMLLELFAATV